MITLDSGLIVGIVIGIIIAVAFLALRKGSVVTPPRVTQPTVRRTEPSAPQEIRDKHAAKSAAVAGQKPTTKQFKGPKLEKRAASSEVRQAPDKMHKGVKRTQTAPPPAAKPAKIQAKPRKEPDAGHSKGPLQ